MAAPAPSAVIYGIAGTALSLDEIRLFSDVDPFGYILFARNCTSPAQVKRLVGELWDTAGRDNIPILIDQEGGRVARLKPPHWPAYPPAATFAKLAAKGPTLAKKAVYLNARLIAQDLAALGITVDCAPIADLPVAGAHDIIGDRAFGTLPQQVIDLARAMADGLMDGGVLPVLKHIPGHGRALADSHEELPVVNTSLEELRRTDFLPFKALADLPMAMTAHVLYTALDKNHMATLSPTVIKLIREELAFDGLLMSDDLSMKAMKGDFAQRTRDTLAAGCDIVLHCNGDLGEMKAIADAVEPLAGKSLARAERVLKRMAPPKPFNAAEARNTLKSLMAA